MKKPSCGLLVVGGFIFLIAAVCLLNAYGRFRLARQADFLQTKLMNAHLNGATSDRIQAFLTSEGIDHSPLSEGPACCFKEQEVDRYVLATMPETYTGIGINEGIYKTNIEIIFVFSPNKRLIDYEVRESFDWR